jgi:fused signal recognition particle receptor
MFKAFKEKLGNVLSKFTKEVEQEEIVEEVTVDSKVDSKKEVVKKPSVVKKTKVKEEVVVEEPVIEEEVVEEPVEEKKGFFSKLKEQITTTSLSEEKFEDLFWDLEIMLMENNMAQEVIDKIKQDLKETLTSKRIQRDTKKLIEETLQNSLREILSVPKIDLDAKIKSKKPFIISMIGVNGSGKTTTLAKLIHKLKKDYSIVVAASDTFRAAAIQQLEEHTTKLGVKLIKHDYKSDPTAVAFDAIKHAESKGLDVVIIDTAGRLHSNDNLMNELKKLDRVCKPDFKIFVGESITGNDCVEQAKVYNEMVGIDAIILSKVDVDEKGGAAISISKVTGKSIIFIGTGQNYDDLEEFDPEKVLETIGF